MSKARGPYRVDPLGYKKANEALDKMADNARELGLDYEPAQQEPVAWSDSEEYGHIRWANEWALDDGTPLYTCPQAREWVGLTDEEKRQLFEREDYDGWLDYINAIEAKLREKNA